MQQQKVKCFSREEVSALYDFWAKRYEIDQRDSRYIAPQIMGANLAKHLEMPTPWILDVGCGTGLAGQYLRQELEGSVLVGIDLSSGMLRKAKRKNAYASLIRGDFCRGNVFPNRSFDATICVSVFEHFENLEMPLAEMARVTNEFIAFYVLLEFYRTDFSFFSPESTLRAVESLGFSPVETIYFTPYGHAKAMGVVAKRTGWAKKPR